MVGCLRKVEKGGGLTVVPATHEGDDLQVGAVLDGLGLPLRLADDLAIQFDSHAGRVETQMDEKRAHIEARRDVLSLAVDMDQDIRTNWLV